MKRLQRAAVLTELADRLRENGSWCGETHVQKSTYLLQELLLVPMEFEFILYKFGPYSFELGDELTELRADELLELKVRHPSYGPTFRTTNASVELRARYPLTLKKYSGHIEFIAESVGDKGVTDLERLATALYVTCHNPDFTSVRMRAERLTELKPHVPLEAAVNAVEQLDLMIHESRVRFSENNT